MQKLIVLGLLFGLILLSGCTTNDTVACTMDAKLCPDGSYVGRVAPDCEFEKCPEFNNVESQTTQLLEYIQERFESNNIAYFEGVEIEKNTEDLLVNAAWNNLEYNYSGVSELPTYSVINQISDREQIIVTTVSYENVDQLYYTYMMKIGEIGSETDALEFITNNLQIGQLTLVEKNEQVKYYKFITEDGKISIEVTNSMFPEEFDNIVAMTIVEISKNSLIS